MFYSHAECLRLVQWFWVSLGKLECCWSVFSAQSEHEHRIGVIFLLFEESAACVVLTSLVSASLVPPFSVVDSLAQCPRILSSHGSPSSSLSPLSAPSTEAQTFPGTGEARTHAPLTFPSPWTLPRSLLGDHLCSSRLFQLL